MIEGHGRFVVGGKVITNSGTFHPKQPTPDGRRPGVEHRNGSPGDLPYVAGFSAAPDTKRPPELMPDPEVPKKLKLLWVACGSKDGLLRVSQGVHAHLKEKGGASCVERRRKRA